MDGSIEDFIREFGSEEYGLSVISSDRPSQINSLMYESFGRSLDIQEETEHGEKNVVALYKPGTDNIIAKSPLESIEESILLVNSDLYSTGAVGIEELSVPDVISNLTNTRFEAVGYPKSDKQKLPLIVISRLIEKHAYTSDGGKLRSSFQKLSRIRSEDGTYDSYKKISQTDTDLHIYGIPDWVPKPEDLNATIHGGYNEAFKNSWFVIYHGDNTESRGLLAYQTREGHWEAVWTRDQKKVQRISSFIEHNL